MVDGPAAAAPSGHRPPRERPGTVGHEITLAVRALQQASTQAQRALAARLRLGHNDLSALDLLVEAEEPLGPVELGDLLGMRSASATVLVDRLEQAGHLVRRAHPTDRRRRILEPTDHARAEVFTALTPLIEPLRQLADSLSPAEATTVLEFLRRATDIFTDYASQDTGSAG